MRRLLPSTKERLQLVAYVFAPLVIGAGCLAAIFFCVLGTSSPPRVTSGIDFDVDASGAFADAAEEITMRKLSGEDDVQQLLPSQNTALNVTADGCASSVDVLMTAFPDPRWWLAARSGRRGVDQRLSIQRGPRGATAQIPPGAVKGVAGAVIPGAIGPVSAFVSRGNYRIPLAVKQWRVDGAPGEFTFVRIQLPDKAFEGVVLRSVIGQTLFLEFEAPWVHDRGFRSCFVVLPALVDGQVTSLSLLGPKGLGSASVTMVGSRGPEDGLTTLSVESGSVAAGESSPPPRDAAVIPSWICGRREKPTQAPQSDCHAIAVVEEPDREEMQQFLLIVLGAIGSAGILGFFDGIRRRLAPWE